MKEFNKVSKTVRDGWMKTRIRDHEFDKITLSPIGSWRIVGSKYKENTNRNQNTYILKDPAEFCATPMTVYIEFSSESKYYTPIKMKYGNEIWNVSHYTFCLNKDNTIHCDVYKILERYTQRKDKWIASYIVRDKMPQLFDDLNLGCMNFVY